MKRSLLVMLLACGSAARGEERVMLTLGPGALVRDDGGYGDHAEVFGLGHAGAAPGVTAEAGVPILPRLWLRGAFELFTSLGARRRDELRVQNLVLVVEAGVTAWHQSFHHHQMMLRLDLFAGGGLYRLSDSLADRARSRSGPGARGGAQLSWGWGVYTLGVVYALHVSGVELEDRLGGRLGAGGHEISLATGVRF